MAPVMPRSVSAARRVAVIAGAIVVLSTLGRPIAQRGSAGGVDVDAVLRHGLQSLHYFEYEDARHAFLEAQRLDPRSVMACWGEAMTYHQTLWRHEDVAAGRRALARLGATRGARAAAARGSKERLLLDAADRLFGDGDADARKREYAAAMGRLYATVPDDPDVAAFYALALLGTMSRSLIGYVDAHEGHSASLAGSDTQRRVSTILRRVLSAQPNHPGALHYLLHNDDDPAHAREALAAARTLAKLAPPSSHARHMPAHIFLQLGLWNEAAAADASAFEASRDNIHALSWLQYERLQQGRFEDARAAITTLEPMVKATGSLELLSDLSTMRARFVVESQRWSELARADQFGNVNELFALGMSAARAGEVPRAERAHQLLAQKQHDEREGDLRPAIAVMERELAAIIAAASGRRDEALALARAASDAETKLPAPLGLPIPIKPAPELLGELLLEAGRPADATAAFGQALARNANRRLSVEGLTRAGGRAGAGRSGSAGRSGKGRKAG